MSGLTRMHTSIPIREISRRKEGSSKKRFLLNIQISHSTIKKPPNSFVNLKIFSIIIHRKPKGNKCTIYFTFKKKRKSQNFNPSRQTKITATLPLQKNCLIQLIACSKIPSKVPNAPLDKPIAQPRGEQKTGKKTRRSPILQNSTFSRAERRTVTPPPTPRNSGGQPSGVRGARRGGASDESKAMIRVSFGFESLGT